MKFDTHKEKLEHIGLMCSLNLHDAFANLSRINYACQNNEISDKEKLNVIKDLSDRTYELFRVIERYKNQIETSEVKTFSASEIGTLLEKYFRMEKMELNVINDFKITCKKTLLLQSLINLIDNAYKHNTNEWDNKKVKLTIDTNQIIVSDNGDGIADNIKDKIFDLFFTTKGLNSLRSEHNGIGLYGVKQSIDALGYKIIVENNTILKGANFKIITN